MKDAEANEQFFYGPVQSNKGATEEDDENFSDAEDTPKQTTSPQTKQTSFTAPPPSQTNNKVFREMNNFSLLFFLLNHLAN